MRIRTYTELTKLETFEERYVYLRLDGSVGDTTFGFDRYMNQMFYKSAEWKSIRNFVISRDLGCDLGMKGCEITGQILIHHMNPISTDDIRESGDLLLNPEYLISTIHATHNQIHYGGERLLIQTPVERKQNDTCPWRQ